MRRLAIPSAAIVGLLLVPSSASAATPNAPFISTSHPVWFVIIVAGLFSLALFGIALYDRVSADVWRRGKFAEFANKVLGMVHGTSKAGGKERNLTPHEAAVILKKVNEPPKTTPGLTRTLLAIGLLALVGIVLAALLVSNAASAPDLLKTVVVGLTASLTTLLGFYFGAKTATDAAAPSMPPPLATPDAGTNGDAGTDSSATPDDGTTTPDAGGDDATAPTT
jgi:hypothetical protein